MTLGKILVSESDISACDRLDSSRRLSRTTATLTCILVGVMDGAVCFLADLMRAFPALCRGRYSPRDSATRAPNPEGS